MGTSAHVKPTNAAQRRATAVVERSWVQVAAPTSNVGAFIGCASTGRVPARVVQAFQCVFYRA